MEIVDSETLNQDSPFPQSAGALQRENPEKGSWRIVLLLETGGGGSGRHVLDLATHLHQLGHETHIIYSPLRMEKQFAEELSRFPGQTFPVEMRRAPHPSDVIALKKISDYCAAYGPFDIAHGHSSKAGALVRLALLPATTRRVYTPHALFTLDPSLHFAKRFVFGAIERVLGKLADGIILVSDEEKAHALDQGLPADRLFVVHNGLRRSEAPTREQALATLGLSSDSLFLGFVGRLAPQKAPERVIDTFARLAARYPRLDLLMVGDGPLAAGLKEQCQTAGLAERVHWVTGKTGVDVMPVFDVLVMTSRYEAFPYVLVEAAASGLPIVTTPVGGASAVVKQNINGYIVNDPEAFEVALSTLFEEHEMRRRMGVESAKIAQGFTVENMVINTCAVYEELLARTLQKAAASRSYA